MAVGAIACAVQPYAGAAPGDGNGKDKKNDRGGSKISTLHFGVTVDEGTTPNAIFWDSGNVIGRITDETGRMVIRSMGDGEDDPIIDPIALCPACAGCFPTPPDRATALISGDGRAVSVFITGNKLNGRSADYELSIATVPVDVNGVETSWDPPYINPDEPPLPPLDSYRLKLGYWTLRTDTGPADKGCTASGDFGGQVTLTVTYQPDLDAAFSDRKGKPDKPGNGGGGDDNAGVLARARFISEVPNGTDWISQAFVTDGGETETCEDYWHYWAPGDGDCTDSESVGQSDVSKGGRWIFSTGNQCGKRYVKVKFPDDSGVDPSNFANELDPESACVELGSIDENGYGNFLIQIIADELFKGRDRQDIRLSFWSLGGGRNYRLEYHDKLYVRLLDETDNLVRLTTEGASYGYGDTNASMADLVMGNGRGEKIAENIEMPLTIEIQRFP